MTNFKLKNGHGTLSAKGCGPQNNKLNTYDWMADITECEEAFDMVEVQFKNTRKGYYKTYRKTCSPANEKGKPETGC